MNVVLVLRLLHIILGVFWAGAIFFLVLFLAPALGRVGPEGRKVMAQLDRARFFEVMPLVALVTILSGAWLMWIGSGGFRPLYFTSRWGLTLTAGAIAAIVAFGVGTAIMRPTSKRLLALGPRVAAAPSDDERERLGAEVGALRRRARTASLWVAGLLLIAVVAMAGARYL